MAKEPSLCSRLYSNAFLHDVARAVGYGGATDAEMRQRLGPLIKAHGDAKVSQALLELTVMERDTNRTILKPEVRTLCWQLLGPPPEHPEFQRFYPNGKLAPAAIPATSAATTNTPSTKKRVRKKGVTP